MLYTTTNIVENIQLINIHIIFYLIHRYAKCPTIWLRWKIIWEFNKRNHSPNCKCSVVISQIGSQLTQREIQFRQKLKGKTKTTTSITTITTNTRTIKSTNEYVYANFTWKSCLIGVLAFSIFFRITKLTVVIIFRLYFMALSGVFAFVGTIIFNSTYNRVIYSNTRQIGTLKWSTHFSRRSAFSYFCIW